MESLHRAGDGRGGLEGSIGFSLKIFSLKLADWSYSHTFCDHVFAQAPAGSTPSSTPTVTPTATPTATPTPTPSSSSGWIPESTGIRSLLTSVSFVDHKHGWATGETGSRILSTTDGGTTWQIRQENGPPMSMGDASAISFVDDSHGFVAGDWLGNGSMMGATSDGGVTWSPTVIFPWNSVYGAPSFAHLALCDSTSGYVVGYDLDPSMHMVIWWMDNSGTYVVRELQGPAGRLDGASCVDSKHCWAVGSNGTVLATTNGGDTWSQQDSGTTSDLSSVCFVDGSHGWAVGGTLDQTEKTYSPTIIETSDGGITWHAQSSPIGDCRLCAVDFVDEVHGWAVGCDYQGDGVILASSDGGATWSQQDFVPGEYLQDVSFVDRDHGWVVGSGGTVLATTDGGVTP